MCEELKSNKYILLRQQFYNINIYIIVHIFIVHMFAFNIFYMKYNEIYILNIFIKFLIKYNKIYINKYNKI